MSKNQLSIKIHRAPDVVAVKSLVEQYGPSRVAFVEVVPAGLAGTAYAVHQFFASDFNFAHGLCAALLLTSGVLASGATNRHIDHEALIERARLQLMRMGRPATIELLGKRASRLLQWQEVKQFGTALVPLLAAAAVAHGAGMLIEHVSRPDAPIPAMAKLQR